MIIEAGHLKMQLYYIVFKSYVNIVIKSNNDYLELKNDLINRFSIG